MAQADQTVQNDTFPTVRADINNNLAALFSNNSGNVAPTTTVAHMDWIDTSGADPVWKKRNAANNGWITVGTIKTSALELANTLPSQTSNNGKFLTTDGTNASWATITASGQLLRAPQILTTGTSYTTPANCTKIYVEAVGGGGGGGGSDTSYDEASGGGGGGGGYCAKYFTVTASTSYTYAIGAGGTAGSGESNPGGTGGNTTFTVGATTITANGGSGGGGGNATSTNSIIPGSGGAGGSASNGDLNIRGSRGQCGIGNVTSLPSSAGGSSFFGAGGSSNEGGGGGNTGSAGGAGLIRIWEYS